MSSSLYRFQFLLFIVSLSASQVFAQSNDCESDDCVKPAYELRIINEGEGSPSADNKTPEGRAQNRRVDVTVTTEQEVEQVVDDRRADFVSGGTVWVSQDPSSLARLLDIKASGGVKLTNGEFDDPVKFTLSTNYADFVSRWEILVWREGQSDSTQALYSVSGTDFYDQLNVTWDGSNAQQIKFDEGDKLEYALRVYDKIGNVDQTQRTLLQIDSSKKIIATQNKPLLADFESINDSDTDRPELARQGIRLRGSLVRVYGQGFDSNSKVDVNGSPVKLSSEGKFAFDVIKEGGIAEFVVTTQNKRDEQKKVLTVDLEQRYFFMVGMADLTVGENRVTGNSEILDVDPHHYGGDIFVDGRLAFYLKGKIKGKYLLTAQMDTGTEDIEQMFDDFHKKDPQSVFRRLDPDQYYPVYGDGSNLRDDTNSQGKLYVRLDWDKSWALWGNYNTAFSGAELAPFNRSLYGAQLVYRSTANTDLGDTKTQLSAFASQAQSLFRRNEFVGTGGSLYYLRDNDIVNGSEKISVEVRREPGGRVIDKVELVAGRDYDIDYFQGRIILRRPLISVATGGNPSIIRDEPLPGDRAWLVVDYEYTPSETNVSDITGGIRAKQWFGDHLAIGGTWVHEARDQQDYDLKGVDVTLKKAANTFIKFETAQTQASFQSARSSSNDGGLSFSNDTTTTDETSGVAASIEAQYSVGDFNPDALEKRVTAWAKQREAGYATSNHSSPVDNSDIGVEAFVAPHINWGLFAKAQRFEQKDLLRESVVSGKIDYTHKKWLTVATEYQHTVEENLSDDSKGTLGVAAASVSANVTQNLNIYGIQQVTVAKTGGSTDNDLTTVGTKYQASEKLKLNAEASSGDRGDSILLGAERMIGSSYQLYSNYVHSVDKANDNEQKRTWVIGQRKSIGSNLKVFSEHQFSSEKSNDSFAHTIGLDNRINKFTSVSLSLQSASLKSDNDESIDRSTLSAGVEYQRNKFRFTGKYEYREDEGQLTDLIQWVTTNRFEYRRSVSLRWQGKFNASLTRDQNVTENARFIEAGIGFAYRPVRHDRLNMLGRLTYLYDLQPASQSSDNDQRSIIVSTEALYDVTKRWSLGGKLSHRASEIRIERNAGAWIGNDASLVGVRLRRHVPFGIDVSASYRWLWSDESEGMREGALFTVGKRVGQHLTFSTGYNFTNFDDNLADDSYDVKGWFLNLVGTY